MGRYMNIDKIITELSYRVSDGTPNLSNHIHILELKSILLEFGYSPTFIKSFINEIDDKETFLAINKDTKQTSTFSSEENRDKAIKSGTHTEHEPKEDGKSELHGDETVKGAHMFQDDENSNGKPKGKGEVDSSDDISYHDELKNEHKASEVFKKQFADVESQLQTGLDVVNSKETQQRIVDTKKNVSTVSNLLPSGVKLSLGSKSSDISKTNIMDVMFNDRKQFNFHFEVGDTKRSATIEKLVNELESKGWEISNFDSKKLTAISPEGKKYSIHSKPSRENSKKQAGEATAYEGTVALSYAIAASGIDSSEWGNVIEELVKNGTYTTPEGVTVDTNDLRADAGLWFSNVDNISKVKENLDELLRNEKLAVEMATAKDLMSKMNLPKGTKLKINCEGGLDTDEFRADIVIYAETPKGERVALIGSSVKDGSSMQLGQLGPRRAVDAIENTEAGSDERREAIRDGGYEQQIQKLPAKMRDKFRDSIVNLEDPEQIHQAMLDSLLESAEETPEVLYDFMVFNIVGTNPPEGLQGFMYQNKDKIRKIPLPGSEDGDKILDNIKRLSKEGRIRKSKDPKKSSFLMYVDEDGKEHPIMKTRTKKTRDGKIERTYIEKGGTKSVLFKLLEGEIGN